MYAKRVINKAVIKYKGLKGTGSIISEVLRGSGVAPIFMELRARTGVFRYTQGRKSLVLRGNLRLRNSGQKGGYQIWGTRLDFPNAKLGLKLSLRGLA